MYQRDGIGDGRDGLGSSASPAVTPHDEWVSMACEVGTDSRKD